MRKIAVVVLSVLLGTEAVSTAGTPPAIGPMSPMDPPLLGRAAYGGPSALSTVWNGKDLFSVWSDRRDPHQNNVFGVHVPSGGAVADQTSVLITTGWNPVVAWDGTNYLLVYAEHVTGSSSDLVAWRLGPDGKLLDSPKLVLSSAVQEPYRVFWTGTEFAVFWDDRPPDATGQGTMARIDRNGSLIGNKLPIWNSGALVNFNSQSLPVAWSGSSFLVAQGYTGPRVQLISNDGKKVGQPFLVTSTTQSNNEPAVASDGTNFLVVWDDNDRGSGIKGVRISPTGQIVDSSPLLLSSLKQVAMLHLTWVGSEYILDFENIGGNTGATQLLRISPAGVPLDAKPVVTSVDQQYHTRIAATSDRLMLIDPGIQAPVGNWLKMDGTASGEPEIPLCAAANRQTWPAVASNGSVTLAVWYDERTVKNPQVRGQIFDVTGKPLRADSFLITQASDLATEPYEVDGPGGRLAVASDGKDFLVAWSLTDLSNNQVRAARVSGSGEVLDSDGIDFANGHGQKNPVVVWTGANYFVTYLMNESDRNSGYVVGGKRIDNKGIPLDGQDLRLGVGDYNDPCVRFTAAWGGDLLVITENGNGGPLNLTRFDATGRLLGKRTSLGNSQEGTQIHPSAVWNGKEYLAAWSQYASGAQNPDIVAARFGADGSMLDRTFLQVSKTGGLHDGASVAWDGNNFVIAWFERTDPTGSDDHWSAFVARVDASGNVLDPGGLRISNTDEYGAHPTVASRGGGDGLLALQRYDSSAGMRAIRVVTRAFSDKAPAETGDACLDSTACRSGFCVDGVCCDSACGGGNAGDCQACSVAAGAKVNGTCGPLAAGVVCRASTGSCDRAELCDGVGLVCPADLGMDGGCGLPEPARDAGILVPDAGAADVPSALTPDASVPDSLARPDATADSSHDLAAPEAGPDLPLDSPVDRLVADAFVATDLALPLDAKAPGAPTTASSSKSGCACHVGGRADVQNSGAIVLLMAAALLARRRRRRGQFHRHATTKISVYYHQAIGPAAVHELAQQEIAWDL